MDVDADVLATFEASLQRCRSDRRFLQRFYQLFLQSSDEVAERFAGVDLDRQADVLDASLYYMLRAARGSPDGRDHLDEIAKSHDKHGHDIKPAWYDLWLSALLTAVSMTDPQHDDSVRAAWTQSLEPCIDTMRKAWDES